MADDLQPAGPTTPASEGKLKEAVGRSLNDYHIYEEIGRGKNSVVYKGRRKKTIHYVAIKSVEKSQRDRLMNEVSLLCSLHHPNVLQFLGWYETNNHLWLIMEYCTGGDMLTLIRQDKMMPETSIRPMSLDIIAGLQYIHSQGYLYCDLKPSNILLNEYGVLKLCDLGLARQIPSDLSMVHSQSMTKRGTPYYMAPELFHREGLHSFSSDLWALGCVLYELASGKPPFYAKSLPELVQLILSAPPAKISASEEFNDLLFRLLEKDSSKRMDWPELLRHPFFLNHPFESRTMPNQPLFRSNKNDSVDIVRLSMNAKLNLAEEPVVEAREIKEPIQHDKISRISNTSINDVETENTKITSNGVEMNTYDVELNFDDKNSTDVMHDIEVDDASAKASSNNASDNDEEIPEDIDETPFSLDVEVPGVNTLTSSRPTSAPIEAMRREEISAPVQARPTTALMSPHGHQIEHNISEKHKLILGMDELLVHSSDVGVKPLVGNSKIEKNIEPKFDAKVLPFACLGADEIVALSPSDLECFLTLIYKAINGDRDYSGLNIPSSLLSNVAPATTVQAKEKERVVILNYFESLCWNTAISNIIINSSLMNLLVSLAWSSPTSKVVVSPAAAAASVPFKAQFVHIMGLLIRHATWIADELAESGVVQALSELLRDKNLKVRRKAVAALGELMYYVATQQENNEQATSAPLWPVTKFTINMLIRCLRAGEDDIVQHYAAKTIENIAAQSNEFTKHWFGVPDLLYALIAIYNSSCNEFLRLTAASAISHLIRRHPNLFNSFLDKFGLIAIRTGLDNYGSPRLQQAFLNIVNRALKEKLPRLSKMMDSDKKFLPCVMALLDHTSPVIRGKAVLSICLLAHLNISWLIKCCEFKLMSIMDKLAKEKDNFLRQCLQYFTLTCRDVLIPLSSSLHDELRKVHTRRANINAAAKTLKEQVMPGLTIMFHLTSSTLLREASTVESPEFVNQLAGFIPYIELLTSLGAISGEYRHVVFSVLESISQPASKLVAISVAEVVIANLFPSLLSLLKSSENGDTRFLALKIFSDILIEYLSEKKIYDAVTASDKRAAASGLVAAKSTKMINELLVTNFLSICKQILSDKEPLPQYALKVLCAMVESNSMFVAVYNRFGLIDVVLSFFQVSHPQLSIHTIKLMLYACQAKEVSRIVLYKSGLSSNLLNVFAFSLRDSVYDWMDPLLELTFFLLTSALSSRSSSVDDAEFAVAKSALIGIFLPSQGEFNLLDIFACLISSSDIYVVELVLRCILLYMELMTTSPDWLVTKNLIDPILESFPSFLSSPEVCSTILNIFNYASKFPAVKSSIVSTSRLLFALRSISSSPAFQSSEVSQAFIEFENEFKK